MTCLDLERAPSIKQFLLPESYVYCENHELIIFLFFFFLQYLSSLGFWKQFFFQELMFKISIFPFNVKASSHLCNQPQRSVHVWILMENPQSHFSCSGEFLDWRGSPPLIHVCRWDFLSAVLCSGFAGLWAVGGRTNSDMSLCCRAASHCILATVKTWGAMKWNQKDGWGRGLLWWKTRSIWSCDSCCSKVLDPLRELGEGWAVFQILYQISGGQWIL